MAYDLRQVPEILTVARQALEAAEWSASNNDIEAVCPVCHQMAHQPECLLARALTVLRAGVPPGTHALSLRERMQQFISPLRKEGVAAKEIEREMGMALREWEFSQARQYFATRHSGRDTQK